MQSGSTTRRVVHHEPAQSAPPPTCTRVRGNPDGEEFEPRFTFHGFQFAEISGHFAASAIEDVTGDRARIGADGDRRVPLRPSVAESAAEQHPVESTRQLRRGTDGLPATRRTAGLDRRCAGVRAHRRVQSRRRGVLHEVAGRSDRRTIRQRNRSAARADAAAADDHARRRRARVGRCNRDLSVDDLPVLRRQTPTRAPLRCDESVRRQHREALSVVDPGRRRDRTVAGVRRLARHRRRAHR